LTHSTDLAGETCGIEAARRYAKIAPAAPHALHMPSHIFTRVGYWQESIDSNMASGRTAKEAGDFHEELHAMDYLVYAYLQLGQDKKAKDVIDEMNTVAGFTESALPGPYGRAASPARYAMERGDWQAAAALDVRPGPLPQVQAITYFARAVGAARSGDPAAAKADIAKLAEFKDKLSQAKDAYWAGQVDVQRQIAAAWVLYAEGKREEALSAMSAAADAEDKTEKHPVTPGVPKPARELYGEMLLESGMAKEALAAFEATLKKEPNRLGATVGRQKPPKSPAIRPRPGNTTARSSPSPATPTRPGPTSATRAPSWQRSRESTPAPARAWCACCSGPKRIASGDRICRRAGRMGVDGHGRHGKGFPANQTIRRTPDDEACRLVHAGGPGGEDRRNTLADIDPVVATEGDSVG
jgi:tetratricopeptide (TPR) repeat protein